MIKRTSVAALVLSASTLVGIALNEGYKDEAYIPVKGDVPTIGFGKTNGVKAGDKTTPQRALVDLLADANAHSEGIKQCITVPLYQYEFDAYSDLAYNIGVGAFCGSTLVKRLNASDYAGACEMTLDFVCGPATEKTRAKAGERCYSKKKPMRVLRGLEVRRQQEYATCRGSV